MGTRGRGGGSFGEKLEREKEIFPLSVLCERVFASPSFRLRPYVSAICTQCALKSYLLRKNEEKYCPQ